MKTFAPLQKSPQQAPASIRAFQPIRRGFATPAFATISPPQVQARLTINEPGDQYEQEADRVAEEVMRSNADRSRASLPTAGGNNGRVLSETTDAFPTPRLGHDFSKIPVTAPPTQVQTKLTVNEPGDKYEQEADRVAEKVMRSSSFFGCAISVGGPPDVQKKCAACESGGGLCPECAEEEEKKLQRKSLNWSLPPLVQREQAQPGDEKDDEEELLKTKSLSGPNFHLTLDINTRVQSLTSSSGMPLPKSERAFFETRLGVDFSPVRVFNDARAADLAHDLNARAFTIGNSIAFGAGQYAPETNDGRRLMAHELTHVVQQNEKMSPSIQRFTCVNNPATAPAAGMAGCSTESSRPTHQNLEVGFIGAGMTIDPAALSSLSTLAARWHAAGRNDTVRIDGFSSCDGGTSLNWKRSCDRAKAIESELKALSDGTPGIPATAAFSKFAHGETEEFSSTTLEDNRKGLVTLQPTVTALPGAVPAAGPTDFRISRIPRSSQTQVFFAGGSSILTADARTQIDNLKSAGPGPVRVIGFASMEEPATVALDRANAVRTRLIAAPNPVTVASAGGNAAATAKRSDFAGARSVEILVGAAVQSTLDCAAVHPAGHPNAGQRINPPKASCATMDPATLTAFNATLPIAIAAMTAAMNAINSAHANHNPALIQRFFGNSDPATLTTLNTNMGNLQTHVSGLSGNLAAPIDGILSVTRCAGQCDTGGCESGATIAYNGGVDATSTNTLCVPEFKSLNINDRVRNLIHESAHGTTPLGGAGAPTEGTKDVAYRHERMMFQLSPADRLRNSDSYALFALYAKEIQTTGSPTAVPSGIGTPATDSITGITGTDRRALELALAQLEKRLTWASDHSNQLFGQAQKVRAGAITWAATWAGDYMREAATRFPVTAPPASPALSDMTMLAAIIERYKMMKFAVKRNLTISAMPSGVINWPAGGGGLASNTLQIGPDFFRATADNQVSLLLENLAGATSGVEPAFIPAYVAFAEFIHRRAA